MRFPSAAKSPVDRLAEPGDEAECGNSPLAITASRCARTKEAAPVITKVKTVNPATARERRNVLKAAKVAITIPRLLASLGEPKPHALQKALPRSPTRLPTLLMPRKVEMFCFARFVKVLNLKNVSRQLRPSHEQIGH